MIFTPPRFIAVDDRPEHLRAIIEAVQQLGAPCMGVHYDAAIGLTPNHLRGVRVLFLDLHLLQGTLGSDDRAHFAHLASMLEANISKDGGPFILIIWTQHAHLNENLKAYLDEKLVPAAVHARPVAVLCLAKESFINLETGTVQDALALRKEVEKVIGSNPQIAALLGWEADVLAAGSATLAALLDLIPSARKKTTDFPKALDELLSRLAREAVGKPNVGTDPRAAITAALVPILTDRLQTQAVSPEEREVWQKAVTRYQDTTLGKASPIEAGRINRMLHLALPEVETIRPTDWGAVVELPEGWSNNEEIERRFGLGLEELLGDEEFLIPAPDRGRCRTRLVRVGAACDHAQGRRGPIPYLFAVEIPSAVKRPEKLFKKAEWRSPLFVPGRGQGDEAVEPFRLAVNSRFLVAVPAAATAGWQVCYRFREQLLMELVSHASEYASRPGMIQMPS